jgi:hypothetical protein
LELHRTHIVRSFNATEMASTMHQPGSVGATD